MGWKKSDLQNSHDRSKQSNMQEQINTENEYNQATEQRRPVSKVSIQ